MRDLLIVGNKTFPVPEGDFSVKLDDVTNEYESETGEKTIEIVRQDVATISVSYNGLLEEQKNELLNSLSTVVEATYYKRGTKVTSEMLVTGITEKKIHHKNDVSVWSFSFSLEEL